MVDSVDDVFTKLNAALQEKKLTEADAERIFEKVETSHKEFQKQLQASMPSYKDRQRIYNL